MRCLCLACQLVVLHALPLEHVGARGLALASSPRAGGGSLCLRGGAGAHRERRPLPSNEQPAEKHPGPGYMGSLSVVFYLLTSLSLTLMNKLIFSQFQYPLVVTHFQVNQRRARVGGCWRPNAALLVRHSPAHRHCCLPFPSSAQLIVSMGMLAGLGEMASATGFLAFIPRVRFETSKWLAIAPVTVLFVTMLSLTNYCLRHVNIGFYQVCAYWRCARVPAVGRWTHASGQVLRSTVIPFNILLNYMLLDILPSAYASFCCLVVVGGFVLGSITELDFRSACACPSTPWRRRIARDRGRASQRCRRQLLRQSAEWLQVLRVEHLMLASMIHLRV